MNRLEHRKRGNGDRILYGRPKLHGSADMIKWRDENPVLRSHEVRIEWEPHLLLMLSRLRRFEMNTTKTYILR